MTKSKRIKPKILVWSNQKAILADPPQRKPDDDDIIAAARTAKSNASSESPNPYQIFIFGYRSLQPENGKNFDKEIQKLEEQDSCFGTALEGFEETRAWKELLVKRINQIC